MQEKIEGIITANVSKRHVKRKKGVGLIEHTFVDDYSQAAAEIAKLFERKVIWEAEGTLNM